MSLVFQSSFKDHSERPYQLDWLVTTKKFNPIPVAIDQHLRALYLTVYDVFMDYTGLREAETSKIVEFFQNVLPHNVRAPYE